jgi:uncharacterized membrane protein YfcA
MVVALASLMLALRQSEVLESVRENWSILILSAVLGGILGRLLGLQTPAPVLMVVLGAYAILAGLHMVLIKPLPEKDDKVHAAWLAASDCAVPAPHVFRRGVACCFIRWILGYRCHGPGSAGGFQRGIILVGDLCTGAPC